MLTGCEPAALRHQATIGPPHPGRALGWDDETCRQSLWLDGSEPIDHPQLWHAVRPPGQRWVLALLALDAHAARHALMAAGLHIEHTGPWQGQPRQWLLLDLQRGPAVRRAAPLPTRWISADDYARQCSATAAGLRGVVERAMPSGAVAWIGYMPLPPSAP